MDELIFFAKRLKETRKLKGQTQKQLAIATSLSERGYQKIENGETSPKLETAIILANILDVYMDYLLGWSDDPTRH